MTAYYNEIDKYCCQWLRNLMAAGLIPQGDVDNRPIQEVQPQDVAGYTQCHFFAGLGGWAYAVRLAGWDDERPIWTGSCPCQPFSVAGRRKGVKDERHLWPDFYRIIRGSRPPVVMGEQVAGAAGYAWLAGVLTDLEKEGYSGRAVDIPACSVGAPHIRNRLYWCADSNSSHQYGRAVAQQVGRVRREEETTEDFWGRNPKRATKPGVPIVAYGVPARMERLCAAGNAIVPQLAAEVIRAYMEVS